MPFPQPIDEDDQSVTFQTPSGAPLRLPKELARSALGYQPQAPAQDAFVPYQAAAPLGQEQGNQGFENQFAGFTQAPEVAQTFSAQGAPAPAPLPEIAQPDPAAIARLPRAQQGLASQQQGFDLQTQAIDRQAEVERRNSEEATRVLEAKGRDLARRDALEAQKQDEERRAEESERADITQALTDVGTQAKKANHAAVIDEMPGGKKVGLAIFAALSGLGSALKGEGDKNPALDIIYKQIDQAVADRMAAIDQAKDGIGMRRQLLGDKVGSFKSRQAQAEALRSRYLEAVAGQLDTIQQRTKSELVKGNAAIQKAQILQAQGQAVDQAFYKEQDARRADRQVSISAGQLALAKRNSEFEQAQQLATMPLDLQQRAANIDATRGQTAAQVAKVQNDIAKAKAEGALYNPETGEQLEAKGPIEPKRAGEIQDKFTAAISLRGKQAEFQGKLKEFGSSWGSIGKDWKLFSSQQKKDLNALRGELIVLKGQQISGASVSPQQLAVLEEQFPPFETLTQRSDPSITVEQFIRRGDDDTRRLLLGSGVTPDAVRKALGDINTAQRGAPPAPTGNPGGDATSVLQNATTTAERATGLKALGRVATADWKQIGSLDLQVGLDQASAVLADPKATAEERRIATVTQSALKKAEKRQVADSQEAQLGRVAKGSVRTAARFLSPGTPLPRED